MQSIAEEVAAAQRLPGLSYAVATPTAVLGSGAVGRADLATGRAATPADQYPWFSMTKIATATTAVSLHAEGALDLDVPVDTYLPEHPVGRGGRPTVRQLLSHTAGLGNPLPIRWIRPEDAPADPTTMTTVVARHGAARRRPGNRAAYSNIGYLVAGQVIEAVTGVCVEQCVTDRVLAPLGLTSTGYRYQAARPRAVGHVRLPRPAVPLLRAALPRGIVGDRADGYTTLRPFLVSGAAYGGLIGPVTDAVRLAAMHAAGPSDPHPVLSPVDVELMRTIRWTGKPFDHGIGWFRKPCDADRSPGFVEHYGTGGGYWNAMRIYPERRLAMVAMANTTSRWDVDQLFTRFAAQASGG